MKSKRTLTIGVLAHVDAGKTTLCEGILYAAGAIRKRGRVDNGDAHLDTHALEKRRGITIFSKQARFETDKIEVNLLDSPGHVDFSTEAERILSVIDYAILVISGSDGVQAHTETLWKLLRKYHIPAFIFVNKMDLPNSDGFNTLLSIKNRMGEQCVDFSSYGSEEFYERVALTNENLLDEFLKTGSISNTSIAEMVYTEKLFPCFFGAALRMNGIEELIDGLENFTLTKTYPDEFGARVFKIERDAQDTRLTYMKLTGGSIAVRDELSYRSRGGEFIEKISMLRQYNGANYVQLSSASAGEILAVAGLTATRPGQGLGFESDLNEPTLEPVLNYRIELPEDCDARTALPKLKQLEEEDPTLNIVWNERLKEIHARLMGEIQIEVLQSLIKERFDMDVKIGNGKIMYRETILTPVEGVGHYEPLRHYAEVHLLMEPLPQGSGLVIGSNVSQNDLDVNWQRLILTHLYEKTHLGVLTGSPITDMKITLVAGLASVKHTEGGDFRQATYRAVRQGLMKAKSVLLEPYYSFEIELPLHQMGRAINDIRIMGGTFSSPTDDGVNAFISGSAPVSSMREYARVLAAYTKGRGKLSCCVSHYARCRDEERIIEKMDYNPEGDLDNTPDSIFCSHGAGVSIKWNRVEEFMHIDANLNLGINRNNTKPTIDRKRDIDERELEEIMLREFGPIRRANYGSKSGQVNRESNSEEPEVFVPKKRELPDYLIIDGYNIIYSWSGLSELAKSDMQLARKKLMDVLANYCGYKKNDIVLIFDGYRVKGNAGERFNYHGIRVAYTRENETADAYIERLIAEIGKNYSVRVVSSDGMIQLSSLRSGVLRMTPSELETEVSGVNAKLNNLMKHLNSSKVSVRIEIPTETIQ